MRLYNYQRRYWMFHRRSEALRFLPKPTTAINHVSKARQDKKYVSARTTIPKELISILPPETDILQIDLGSAHLIRNKKDMWGTAHLILSPIDQEIANYSLKFDTRKHYYRKPKKKKIMRHNRKANGTKYTIGKLYLPQTARGKKLWWIQVTKPSLLVQEGKLREDIFETRTVAPPITTPCNAVIIFYETGKPQSNITKKRRLRSYEITLLQLEGKTIGQVAKKRKLTKDTIWSHIVLALREKKINQTQFLELMREHIAQEVRDIIVNVALQNKEIFFPTQPPIGVMQKIIARESNVEMPKHMVKAVIIYLRSVLKETDNRPKGLKKYRFNS